MKRYLRDNPVGPLPNMRMRYLSKEQKLTYLRAAIEDSERSGVAKGFCLKKWIARIRDRKKLTRSRISKRLSKQVGAIDRANPRFSKIQEEDDI